ncbi:hypothetical protein Q0M94_24505 (plasmid) [Deinococcus radiomollis]|uniref:hypothetical protein n=1 Tax=Deinococcus radiomollis TaxID=468916 RepID=UPI003891CD28
MPEQTAKDFSFTNSSVQVSPAQVIYMMGNQLANMPIPALPYQRVSVDADLTYRGRAPALRLEIFASAQVPDCRVVESNLPGYSPAYLCEGPASGQAIGEIVATPNNVSTVHLEGLSLERALRAKSLYLGIRLLQGQPGVNEMFFVHNIRFRTYL